MFRKHGRLPQIDRQSGFLPDAGDILGLWVNEEHDGGIRIYRCGREYCGDILWTGNGLVVDVNNPKPELRKRRSIGLNIMQGFHDLINASVIPK